MKFFLNVILLMFYAAFAVAQCNDRYNTEIFSEIADTTVEYSDVYNLDVDIYQPVGDTVSSRPLILFAHGGSFYGGSKNNPAMISLCTSFAKRGYVTASIEYRLTESTSLLDSMLMLEVVMKAISDSKAAVRYFRRNVDQEGNMYGVDPNQIYFGGYSAGAIIAVNHAFIDDTDEIPSYLEPIVDNVGGLEGNSGNIGYSSKVKAVINLAGGVYKPSFIETDDEPIVSLHAIDDGTVDYLCGGVMQGGLGGIVDLIDLCGSGKIHEKAEAEGLYHDLYTFENGDHAAPFDNFDDLSIPFISDFIYTTLDCYEGAVTSWDCVNSSCINPGDGSGQYNSYSACVEQCDVTNVSLNKVHVGATFFPNPASHFITITMSGMRNVRLLDLTGRVAFEESVLGDIHYVNIEGIKSGVYFLQTASENTSFIQKIFIE